MGWKLGRLIKTRQSHLAQESWLFQKFHKQKNESITWGLGWGGSATLQVHSLLLHRAKELWISDAHFSCGGLKTCIILKMTPHSLPSYDTGLLPPLLGISFFSLVVGRLYISNLHKSVAVAYNIYFPATLGSLGNSFSALGKKNPTNKRRWCFHDYWCFSRGSWFPPESMAQTELTFLVSVAWSIFQQIVVGITAQNREACEKGPEMPVCDQPRVHLDDGWAVRNYSAEIWPLHSPSALGQL